MLFVIVTYANSDLAGTFRNERTDEIRIIKVFQHVNIEYL